MYHVSPLFKCWFGLGGWSGIDLVLVWSDLGLSVGLFLVRDASKILLFSIALQWRPRVSLCEKPIGPKLSIV